MSWLWAWWIKKADKDRPTSTLPEAQQARKTSEQDLKKIRHQRLEVERLANDLRAATVQAKITEIFEGTIKRGPTHG